MSDAVTRALAMQRLQLASDDQRARLIGYGREIVPLFAAADHVQDGARWVRHHPEAVVGVLSLLAAARPVVRQRLWRWSKRGFVAWKLWRNSTHWLEQHASRSRDV